MHSGVLSPVTLSIEAIARIVKDHVPESSTLEFKETLVLDKPETKRDLVRDVTAFANASGGSIVVGISEKGMPCHAPMWGHLATVDAEKIRQQVIDLCASHVDPAIPGLDVRTELVPETSLVVITVPAAGQIPHAVIGFDGKTEYYVRVNDTKKQMTPTELQAAFARVSSRRDTSEPRDDFPNGRSAVAEALQDAKEKAGGRPFFFIAGAPAELHADALDLQSPEPRQILARDADDDSLEAALGKIASRAKMTSRDISVCLDPYDFSLRDDGLMTWSVRIGGNAHFLQSWREDRERVFNQYAVVGYPLSFARLFCALRDIMRGTSGPCVMQMAYGGCQNITLYPGHVGLERYTSMPVSCDADKGRTSEQLIRAPFEPKEFNSLLHADWIARELLKHLYQAFGYAQEDIPFWDDTAKEFDLDPTQHRQP